MLYDSYNAWNECPEADDCELTRSFRKLMDAMVRNIQPLKAEAIQVRYRLAMKMDPERKQSTAFDILLELNTPHYNSLAYQEFSRICYDGETPWPSKNSQTPCYNLQKGSTTAGIKLARFLYN